MPLMDPVTGLKKCTSCGETKQNGKGETFFRNPSAKDGYSTICKDCRKQYNKKAPEYQERRAARQAERPAPEPINQLTPKQVPLTHSRPEIDAIAKETGLVYAGSLVVNRKSINITENQKGKPQHEDIDSGFSIRVPVFRRPA